MIDRGCKIKTADVGGWYDCGKVETVLETNRHLLENGRAMRPSVADGVVIVDPVRIAQDVDLEQCTIGPNVTIEEGAAVRRSVIKEAIIGRATRVRDSDLAQVLVGDRTEVVGRTGTGLVAAGDEIENAR